MSVDPARVPGVRFGELVERRAARQPDRPAIEFEGTTLTYGELRDQVAAFHTILVHRGVRPGDRVLCMSGNRPEFLIAFFATARSGAVFVPVNPAAPAAEIAGLLRDATPAVVLAEETTRGVLGEAVGLAAPPDGSWPLHVDTLDAAHPAPPERPAGTHPVGTDDPALIVYTSGTTGRPKGVVLTHGALFWNQVNVLLGLDVCSDDVTLVNTPLFHVAALTTLAVATLHKGGTVVLHRGFSAEDCLRAVREQRVTTMFAVPTMLSLLERHPGFETADLSSLRWMLVGGAALSPDTVPRWSHRGVALLASYGLSEAGPSVSFRTPAQAAQKPGSSGPPALLTELDVVGPKGERLPAGAVGELVVRGPHLASGYWNNSEATAETFRADGLYTGDRGLIDNEGAVVVTGRSKDVIITGGENVDPVEVEHALAAHPQVAEAVVIGVDDPVWGERVTAVVIPRGTQPPTLPELQDFVSSRVARYKIPRHLEIVDTLPRTPAGKIRRSDVRLLVRDPDTVPPTGS